MSWLSGLKRQFAKLEGAVKSPREFESHTHCQVYMPLVLMAAQHTPNVHVKVRVLGGMHIQRLGLNTLCSTIYTK